MLKKLNQKLAKFHLWCVLPKIESMHQSEFKKNIVPDKNICVNLNGKRILKIYRCKRNRNQSHSFYLKLLLLIVFIFLESRSKLSKEKTVEKVDAKWGSTIRFTMNRRKNESLWCASRLVLFNHHTNMKNTFGSIIYISV